MKYHFKIHKEKKGYWAECLELSGCHTQAETLEELKTNMQQVLNLYLDEPEISSMVFRFPLKHPRGVRIVEVPVQPRIAFAVYLRQLRHSKKMTQREVAKKLGIRHIINYQRLENAKTANPQLATIIELKRVFPELSLDEVLSA